MCWRVAIAALLWLTTGGQIGRIINPNYPQRRNVRVALDGGHGVHDALGIGRDLRIADVRNAQNVSSPHYATVWLCVYGAGKESEPERGGKKRISFHDDESFMGSSVCVVYTPKAFTNSSPGQRPGIALDKNEPTLKALAR